MKTFIPANFDDMSKGRASMDQAKTYLCVNEIINVGVRRRTKIKSCNMAFGEK